MRTKKIALNMVSDILPYIIIGVIGLIKVDVLIKYIGDVGNGYYQVINQIITYVFIAQMGFSDAVIYSLYKPFADKNKGDINRIYSGSRKIFKIIGWVILLIIALVSLGLYFFYGFEDGYRNSSLICFIVISVSYLISYFGKTQTYSAVLSAAQEKYIYNLVFNIMKILSDILIVVVVILFKSLEAIAIVIFIVKALEEMVMRMVVKRKYKWLKEVEDADTSMVKMVKDLAWIQLGYLALNNIDAIILVAFVSPVAVSIYTSYNFIVRYLNEISSRVERGAVYSFGNVFAKKEDDKAEKLFKEFNVLFIIIAFSVCITFTLGIRSFVNVWIGKENYILGYLSIILFATSLFLNIIYDPLLAVVNAKGLFKDNKNHVFICATVNVVLSILLVKPFGLNGLLLATALAFFVNIFLKMNVIKNKIIEGIDKRRLATEYLGLIALFIIICVLIKPLEVFILHKGFGFMGCILSLGIIFIVVTLINVLIMCSCSESTRNLLKRGKGLIKGLKKH